MGCDDGTGIDVGESKVDDGTRQAEGIPLAGQADTAAGIGRMLAVIVERIAIFPVVDETRFPRRLQETLPNDAHGRDGRAGQVGENIGEMRQISAGLWAYLLQANRLGQQCMSYRLASQQQVDERQDAASMTMVVKSRVVRQEGGVQQAVPPLRLGIDRYPAARVEIFLVLKIVEGATDGSVGEHDVGDPAEDMSLIEATQRPVDATELARPGGLRMQQQARAFDAAAGQHVMMGGHEATIVAGCHHDPLESPALVGKSKIDGGALQVNAQVRRIGQPVRMDEPAVDLPAPSLEAVEPNRLRCPTPILGRSPEDRLAAVESARGDGIVARDVSVFDRPAGLRDMLATLEVDVVVGNAAPAPD
jgi:hypothetical protein